MGHLAQGCREVTAEIGVGTQKLLADTLTPQPAGRSCRTYEVYILDKATGPSVTAQILDRHTYSVDVLWCGCVCSVRPVALEGEVVFGPGKKKRCIKNTISSSPDSILSQYLGADSICIAIFEYCDSTSIVIRYYDLLPLFTS